MPLPRFRLRTLMIAVAVVGFDCWLAREDQIINYAVAPPLFGAVLVGIVSRKQFRGALFGGLTGSLIVFLRYVNDTRMEIDPGYRPHVLTWDDVLFGLLVFPAIGLFVGAVIGFVFVVSENFREASKQD